MAPGEQFEWAWGVVDAAHDGGAGDIAKLFKMEQVKAPGIFATNAPPAAATLLAREVIQNSADAASERQRTSDGGAPPFEMHFRFATLGGAERDRLVETLGLAGHAQRFADGERDAKATADHEKFRRSVGLPNVDWMSAVAEDAPLRVLRIDERGTTGMYGNFRKGESRMYMALVTLGITLKADGSGGSFGYGKAGLIAASAMRVIVAYSRFAPRDDDPGVTRRLLGMTYWGLHEVDGKRYTGFARFGEQDEEGVWPFENEAADRIAAALGFDDRSGDGPEALGTSFLVLEPTIEPAHLCTAIERNWWPALACNADVPLLARIEDVAVDGTRTAHFPRPKQNKDLQPFIRGFELADRTHENSKVEEYRKDLGTSGAGANAVPLGWIGLTADTTAGGWSYAIAPGIDDAGDEEDDAVAAVQHQSLVALIRGPRMVVEYLPLRGSAPFVRGAVIADPDVDELLRQTEPKAHDAWQYRNIDSDAADPRAIKAATKMHRQIKKHVSEFRQRLKPPAPESGDILLPEIQRLFGAILSGKGPGTPPPPVGDSDFSISVTTKPAVAPDGDRITTKARIHICLADNFVMPGADEAGEHDTSTAQVRIAWQFIEGGKASAVRQPIEINVPKGGDWVSDGDGTGIHTGTIGRERVEFSFTTEPYDADWTGRVVVEAIIVTDADAEVPA